MSKRRWWDLAVIAAAVVAGIAMSSAPWKVYADQKKKADADRVALRKAEGEVTELTETRHRLESPVGREERAREMGYLKPGEKPLDR